MAIKELGFTENIKQLTTYSDATNNNIARVIAIHKQRYIVRNDNNIYKGEITGNLMHNATCNSDYPAIGDWVNIINIDSENIVIISIYKRLSRLERKAIGKSSDKQLIATNIDTAFITMSVNNDFNLNRLDRYISICIDGNVKPTLLLTKCDLISPEELNRMVKDIENRFCELETFTLSIKDKCSLKSVTDYMIMYRTYCFIGSSGVGKSTLINYLLGEEQIETSEISDSTQKGRHTTTHRELFILKNGSIVIDTPGMREVGISVSSQTIDTTFRKISEYSEKCRYTDCTHTNEPYCAVLNAINKGNISTDEYNNYMNLRREQQHYSESVKDRKERGKALSKTIKQFKKQKRHRRY